MDESHSIHTTRAQVTEPHDIPLPPSILSAHVDWNKDDSEEMQEEKPEKSKEPKELQHRNVDDNTRFWQTYVSESGKFDKELIESWNDNLDSLLLFAALFSAINTAFIIESYKRLQPDGVDSTNSLLKLMLQHRNDNETISLEDDDWSPSSDAVRVNAELFASLASSILASFGAILGKEMVAEFKSSGALNTLPEQGRTRQRKYNGLKRYRFRLLMQTLPILLQLSLALFLIGIIDFLLQMSLTVAIVIIIPVALGLLLYVVSLVVAIQEEDSPFQASLSKSLRPPLLILKRLCEFSLRQSRRFHTSNVAQDRIGWSRTRRFVQPIATTIQESSLWMAVSSGVGRIIDNSGIIGGLRNRWNELDTRIWTTLYIAELGVIGWFMRGGEVLASVLWSGKSKVDEDLRYAATRDVVSSDCAVWLLEHSQDTEVVQQALETLHLLPADIILKRFRAQPKILERYMQMYKSAMQRRPGDVDFSLDSTDIRDAVISGSALFHVLKLRLEDDETSYQVIHFDPDPELIEILLNQRKFEKPEVAALSMVVYCIICVRPRTGDDGLWLNKIDIVLLYKLLDRFLDMIPGQLEAAEVTDTSAPPHIATQDSFTPTISPITLLLDSFIHLFLRQLHLWYIYFPFSKIHDILKTHPASMALTSHVALLLAVAQWSKEKSNSLSNSADCKQGKEFEFNGIKLAQIRKAWISVDKRPDFLDNILLAFDLIGQNDSSETLRIYTDLLELMEIFIPKVMDVSYRHKEWSKWWSKIVRIIPGLLRLTGQVDLTEHPETGSIVIRIIARLLPDDWSASRVKVELSKTQYAKLQLISPTHPEHGQDITTLIRFALSTFNTSTLSPETVRSTAEILGWIGLYPGLIAELPSLANIPGGIYHQSTSVPSFLASVYRNHRDMTYELADMCQHHWKALLTMPLHEAPKRAVRVQHEALAIALASMEKVKNRSFDENALSEGIETLLNKITQSHETLVWPSSFVEGNSFDAFEWVVIREGDSERKVPQMKQVVLDWRSGLTQFHFVLHGEALMILWRLLTQQEGFDPADVLYMFREDVILVVLDCLENAVEIDCQISCRTMEDYLENALEQGWVKDELKRGIDEALALLRFEASEGWDALVIKAIADKEAKNAGGLEQQVEQDQTWTTNEESGADVVSPVDPPEQPE
ncbi:hypothetical protein FRC02_001605 [Tulasnella sp. 418]|nr:hypothetical protein FRC02_001605 [Tulasnella sp. 418]